MKLTSTRDAAARVTPAAAILRGISPDGGLFVPTEFPAVSLNEIKEMAGEDYKARAMRILSAFLTDYDEKTLKGYIEKAYGTQFDGDSPAPVSKLENGKYVLELWHGPTMAFKDMALQLLPHLLTGASRMLGSDERSLILAATSGDTGKAAMAGFADVRDTAILVFYPRGGVSEAQRLQMVTQRGGNVSAVAVEGNFDDTQTGVKNIFGDEDMADWLQERGWRFTSANSINFGRLVPQVVYYFSAYADLVQKDEIRCGDPVNFVVPTGNFGNILAGYYAKRMGLPMNRLVCASNSNNVLSEFFTDGRYNSHREFHKTLSPSMDILISSNLERLLFEVCGRDGETVKAWMDQLKQKGSYAVPGTVQNHIRENFWAAWADDGMTSEAIGDAFKRYHYLMDPHTAVGYRVYQDYRDITGDDTATVMVSTASPFKFCKDVGRALGERGERSELDWAKWLTEKSGLVPPESFSELYELPIRHKGVCEKEAMEEAVQNFVASL